MGSLGGGLELALSALPPWVRWPWQDNMASHIAKGLFQMHTYIPQDQPCLVPLKDIFSSFWIDSRYFSQLEQAQQIKDPATSDVWKNVLCTVCLVVTVALCFLSCCWQYSRSVWQVLAMVQSCPQTGRFTAVLFAVPTKKRCECILEWLHTWALTLSTCYIT